MNYLAGWFNSIVNPHNASANAIGPNAIGPNAMGANAMGANANAIGPNEIGPSDPDPAKPCALEQGKLLHREQFLRAETLQRNLRVMQERIGKHDILEGFDTIASNNTLGKNNSQLSETTTLSTDFDKKIARYTTEQPLFIDEMRNNIQLNDRTKNVKGREFNEITVDKEGCYKTAGASGLENQADMTDVSVQTCKIRASDLGYAGFAIRKNSSGQFGCYLTNDIAQAKSGGIATKAETSYAFKTSSDANKGGLLANGQIGIYNNTIDNNLITDLDGIAGCDAKGNGLLINEQSVVATYGSNCAK